MPPADPVIFREAAISSGGEEGATPSQPIYTPNFLKLS